MVTLHLPFACLPLLLHPQHQHPPPSLLASPVISHFRLLRRSPLYQRQSENVNLITERGEMKGRGREPGREGTSGPNIAATGLVVGRLKSQETILSPEQNRVRFLMVNRVLAKQKTFDIVNVIFDK